LPVTPTQNDDPVQKTARGSPVAGTFSGAPHDAPFQMTASSVLSRNTQKDELEHEITEVPRVPFGSESTKMGADQDAPFQRETASMASAATQKVDDAQATEMAGPVMGSTVWGDDQPAGSASLWAAP
jgi:hypothetical protein